jgi:hypothetical protein
MQLLDLTGQRFGHLVAFQRVGMRWGGGLWECLCDCGNAVRISSGNLRSGHSQSCGCTRKARLAELKTTHGHTKTSSRTAVEYKIWRDMLRRCQDERAGNFRYYGARGITVCERWSKGEGGRSGLDCFLADLGPRPSRDHSIDRIKNDRGYEPGNVRWATTDEQLRNRTKSRQVVYRGETMSIAEARRRAGCVVSRQLASLRLAKGWSTESAVESPPTSRKD